MGQTLPKIADGKLWQSVRKWAKGAELSIFSSACMVRHFIIELIRIDLYFSLKGYFSDNFLLKNVVFQFAVHKFSLLHRFFHGLFRLQPGLLSDEARFLG